jgi:hypothetical protein
VVVALDAAAADTKATAALLALLAPLIVPTEPAKVIALRSHWGSPGKKKWGNRLRWLECWLAPLLTTLKSQAQIELLKAKTRFTQWWAP